MQERMIWVEHVTLQDQISWPSDHKCVWGTAGIDPHQDKDLEVDTLAHNYPVKMLSNIH